jgi:hypothetical protein
MTDESPTSNDFSLVPGPEADFSTLSPPASFSLSIVKNALRKLDDGRLPGDFESLNRFKLLIELAAKLEREERTNGELRELIQRVDALERAVARLSR